MQILDELSEDSDNEELGNENLAYTRIYLKKMTLSKKEDSFWKMLRYENEEFKEKKKKVFDEHKVTTIKVTNAI